MKHYLDLKTAESEKSQDYIITLSKRVTEL